MRGSAFCPRATMRSASSGSGSCSASASAIGALRKAKRSFVVSPSTWAGEGEPARHLTK
jgi:hypothetical protein